MKRLRSVICIITATLFATALAYAAPPGNGLDLNNPGLVNNPSLSGSSGDVALGTPNDIVVNAGYVVALLDKNAENNYFESNTGANALVALLRNNSFENTGANAPPNLPGTMLTAFKIDSLAANANIQALARANIVNGNVTYPARSGLDYMVNPALTGIFNGNNAFKIEPSIAANGKEKTNGEPSTGTARMEKKNSDINTAAKESFNAGADLIAEMNFNGLTANTGSNVMT